MCVCVYTHTDVCMCIKLNHFTVYQKLIQHCKSTILQLKNNNNSTSSNPCQEDNPETRV